MTTMTTVTAVTTPAGRMDGLTDAGATGTGEGDNVNTEDELMTESELDATLEFWSLATQYADACLQRRVLKRKVPQCIYYAIWQTYRYDWDTPSGEVEKPCYMQSVRTAVDRFDPLPIEEHCAPCQERAKLQSEIRLLTYKMGSLKRKMLTQREKMNPSKDMPLDATAER